MNVSRALLVTAVAASAVCTCAGSIQADQLQSAAEGTRWEVRLSQGFDALCALNLLSGDEYYLKQYPAESLEFSSPRYRSARGPAARLRHTIKDEYGGIVSAFLTLVFSGGPDSTLGAVLASARNPARLRGPFRASPFWSQESWDRFLRVRPQVVAALEAMHRAGFERDWDRHLGDGAQAQIAHTGAELSRYDVLGEQTRLLGHELQAGRIEVILLWYSRPHGIRIQGGRFLTNIGYPATVVLRNAVHEPLHPPYDPANPGMVAAVASLSRDSLIVGIVHGHNPSFGYTTISGFVEEDAVQALEQVVSERLGIAVPAGQRWRESDDGMHLLAASIYQLMKETGFAERGGNFEQWFIETVADGRLGPTEVAKRARAVVGNEVVERWQDAAR